MIRLGVTGHQERDGIDWDWVRSAIARFLSDVSRPIVGYSSLAAGADQVFASTLIEHGATIRAVIPLADYERYFNAEALESYHRILEQSERIDLPAETDDPEECFFRAGVFIADNSQVMLAIWDEQNAKGHGGTADIVNHCRQTGVPVIIINPISRTIVPPHYSAVASGSPKKQ